MLRFNQHNEVSGTLEVKALSDAAPPREQYVPREKNHDPVIITAVKEFTETGRLPDGSKPTNTWLAKQIGMTMPVVSAYLSGTYKGDVAKVERLLGDVLKSVKQREEDNHTLFETPVTVEINAACERTKKRNRIALVFAPAGVGKTSGIELYRQSNPTCVVFTAMRGERNDKAIERGLFRQIATHRYSAKRGETRLQFLISHFRGSNRLIIIDNAHRLSRSGRQFIFDFHDATGCPFCLVGNPEVLEDIRGDDQMFSRISLKIEIPFPAASQARAMADELMAKMCPDHARSLLTLATQVIQNFGHVRALRYQLEETLDLFEGGAFKTIQQAFKAAHTQLVREYSLKDE